MGSLHGWHAEAPADLMPATPPSRRSRPRAALTRCRHVGGKLKRSDSTLGAIHADNDPDIAVGLCAASALVRIAMHHIAWSEVPRTRDLGPGPVERSPDLEELRSGAGPKTLGPRTKLPIDRLTIPALSGVWMR